MRRVLAGVRCLPDGYVVAACFVPCKAGIGDIPANHVRYDAWTFRGEQAEDRALDVLWRGSTHRPDRRLFLGEFVSRRDWDTLQTGPTLDAFQDVNWSGFTGDAGRAGAARTALKKAVSAPEPEAEPPEMRAGRGRGARSGWRGRSGWRSRRS